MEQNTRQAATSLIETEQTHRLLVKQYNTLFAMTVGDDDPEAEAELAKLAKMLDFCRDSTT